MADENMTAQTDTGAAVGGEATASENSVTQEQAGDGTLLGGEKKPEAADDAETPNQEAGQDEAEGGETEEQKGAPEEYADFTMPEGMQIDEAVAGELKTLAKAYNMPQEAAQQLVDMGAKLVQQTQESQLENWQQQQKAWIESAKSDEEIGGGKFDETLHVARQARRAFGSDAFLEALEITGVGNHPEMIRFMYRVGKASLKEDTLEGDGQETGGQPRSVADRLWGQNDNK